jgi:hypothetical protein
VWPARAGQALQAGVALGAVRNRAPASCRVRAQPDASEHAGAANCRVRAPARRWRAHLHMAPGTGGCAS